MYYEKTLNKKKTGEVMKNSIIDQYGTIVEYARVTGQVYQTVHSWTSGERLPELEDMVANCNILNIPLEYALVGTNHNCAKSDDNILCEDEYREEARYKCPNLIFSDIAMIIPLLNVRNFIDIVNRASDCNDSHYILNLFQRCIRLRDLMDNRKEQLSELSRKVQKSLDETKKSCNELINSGLIEIVGKEYMLTAKVYEALKSDVEYTRDKTVQYIKAKNMILEYLQTSDQITSAKIQEMCGFTKQQARSVIDKMRSEELIDICRKGNKSYYVRL